MASVHGRLVPLAARASPGHQSFVSSRVYGDVRSADAIRRGPRHAGKHLQVPGQSEGRVAPGIARAARLVAWTFLTV
jgi:hypothetical protein